MLDFSFGEILVIAIIAVIFLGPDKLPQTFVKIAKFLRAVKKTINDAKDTLDREIHITEMKQDALEYKKKFEDSALKLKSEIIESANLSSHLEPTKTALQNELEGLKSEIESLKVADKLNEPLEKSSVSFDDIESKGKELQNRLKKNLKPTKNVKDLGESKGESSESESKKAKSAKVTKDSSKSAESAESKKTKKSKDSTPKKAKNTKNVKDSKDSSDSTTKKRESKVESKPKKSKKSKNANSK